MIKRNTLTSRVLRNKLTAKDLKEICKIVAEISQASREGDR